MEIEIINLQKKIPLKTSQIETIVRAILNQLKIRNSVLSVVFVSSQKIRALNRKFLHRSYATDVLAFDLGGNGHAASSRAQQSFKKTITGDVIISTDAVIQNSRKFNTAESQELVLYIIHGILHLIGYDDHEDKDIQLMRQKEKEILHHLGAIINTAMA